MLNDGIHHQILPLDWAIGSLRCYQPTLQTMVMLHFQATEMSDGVPNEDRSLHEVFEASTKNRSIQSPM
eukprot:gene13916-4080_t